MCILSCEWCCVVQRGMPSWQGGHHRAGRHPVVGKGGKTCFWIPGCFAARTDVSMSSNVCLGGRALPTVGGRASSSGG
ncbi:hypothetical protein HanRHA438_Chr01g0011281 [Helianthus annuus]|nr:hypothetical protein HanRHA438_Chr01g0011281 [Helianthus annuus]